MASFPEVGGELHLLSAGLRLLKAESACVVQMLTDWNVHVQ